MSSVVTAIGEERRGGGSHSCGWRPPRHPHFLPIVDRARFFSNFTAKERLLSLKLHAQMINTHNLVPGACDPLDRRSGIVLLWTIRKTGIKNSSFRFDCVRRVGDFGRNEQLFSSQSDLTVFLAGF